MLSGCRQLGVNKDWSHEGIVLGMENRSKSNQLSRDSLEVLFRENLLEQYSRDPETAFRSLLAALLKDPEKQRDPQRLYTAAEFANLLGERKAPPWNRRPFIKPRGKVPFRGEEIKNRISSLLDRYKDLLTYYSLASYFSYSYIAVASEHLDQEAYNPRFRQACEIYNYSLEQTLRFTLDAAPFDPDSFYQLGGDSGAVKVHFEFVGFDWDKKDIHELLPARDYRSSEIGPTSRWKGLGVPLIGIRYKDEQIPSDFFPKVCGFPVTALYIPYEEYDLEATENRETIYLVNPWNKTTVKVGNSEIPVEADLSTPLNYMLEKTGFNSRVLEGFRGNDEDFRGEVFLIQPHHHGRIPIVLCHGLLSSPEPWETLVNGLMSDPWVRRHYEFWFMHYPTGRGILLNAADLREALSEVREGLDPEGNDPALEKMILVGHSMGGLLSLLLTHDSGDAIWNEFWKVPIERLELTASERKELDRIFFFDRLSFIRRVILLGTPYRGSPAASRPLGWVASRLAELPSRVGDMFDELYKRNARYSIVKPSKNRFLSIPDLRPDSALLRGLHRLRHPPDVVFHSVAGNIADSTEEGTDGIVPLSSAAIDWADTRTVVPSKHRFIQRHPITINLIHRLLREHLAHTADSDRHSFRENGDFPQDQSESGSDSSADSTRAGMSEITWESSNQ